MVFPYFRILNNNNICCEGCIFEILIFFLAFYSANPSILTEIWLEIKVWDNKHSQSVWTPTYKKAPQPVRCVCQKLGQPLKEHIGNCRDPFVYLPSQWELTLQCNVGSHWLSACTKWSLNWYNWTFCCGIFKSPATRSVWWLVLDIFILFWVVFYMHFIAYVTVMFTDILAPKNRHQAISINHTFWSMIVG